MAMPILLQPTTNLCVKMACRSNNGARFNIARFDVFHNNGRSQLNTPYLLDIQSNHLEALDTRVVIPLIRCNCFLKLNYRRI